MSEQQNVGYFTSPLRVGGCLELMSGSREPLSREALTELAGAGRITDSPNAHRDRIRAEVFRLGGERARVSRLLRFKPTQASASRAGTALS